MTKKSIVQKSLGLALLVSLVAPLGACNKGAETPAPEATTPTETTAPAPEATTSPEAEDSEETEDGDEGGEGGEN